MKRTNHVAIPEPILLLQKQLDEFRASHRVRTKLPDGLWRAAVELARQYGVYAVAHPLRLDHSGLSQRVNPAPRPTAGEHQAKKSTFVELLPVDPTAARPANVDGCVIEFESGRGGKMRIQWPGRETPDWQSLLRAWREAGE